MSSTPPNSEPSGTNPKPLQPPRVPDHELIRRIGRGAYGEVWLARSATGAFRAVKIVHRQSFDHDRPFDREFEGILKFEPVSRTHDSQVDILHVGRGDDCFYYVMELADDQATGGQINPDNYAPRTLKSDLLFHGRLPFEECVRIGLALATALENLHGNGLAHRDVKPSNIIFVNGVPKLADIGLVAGVEATRSYVGTEGFAAPEGPGTAQADLYSLGKVLYEISTGKDRQEFPELPTQLRELPDRDGLMELNSVIARACRHDPKDRYASARAMRADLELLQSGKSLARLHRTEKRLRLVQRAGAVVTAIAALIAAGWLWQTRQTHKVRELVTEKAALAEENRERLVRLNIANGVRLMDADDYSGALLWFAEALPLLANKPAEEAIHRVRIQQVLSQSPRLLQVMPHDASVASGAFSPDGRRVATGTSKGDLRIWDADSGATVLGPLHLGKIIQDVRFTKEGTRLFVRSCTDQGKARGDPETGDFAVVLNAATGQPVFPGVTNAVRTVFSPDDRLLAVARRDFVIEVRDAMNGQSIAELTGHTNGITMLSFDPDGSLLASASRDQTVRLWRLPSGEPMGRPLRHAESVLRAVISPDARRLATVTEAPSGEKWSFIHTWDTATGMENASATKAASPVFALEFDPANSRRLIVADANHWITVEDADCRQAVLPPLKFESSMARSWAFSPDGLRFAAGSEDHTAGVWDLETGLPLTPSLRHVGWVESVSFSPDGSRLLTTSDDETAKIWDLTALPEAAKPLQLDAQDFPIDDTADAAWLFPPALSSDGRRLLIFVLDFTLRLVDLETLRQEGAPMPPPDADVAGVIQFDPSGRQWAAALGLYVGNGQSRSVSLWREEDGKLRHFELRHPKAVQFAQFNADGSRLVTWSTDSRVRTWQAADGKLLEEREIPDIYSRMTALSTDGARAVMTRKKGSLHELLELGKPGATGVPLAGIFQINTAAFSPEGDRVATVGGDQHGHIWDARTGQALAPPFKHNGILFWIERSPDGRRVLTAGMSARARAWDATTGETAASMFFGRSPVRVAHFSPDGRFVVARSDDQFVRVWDSATAEPVIPLLKHAGAVRAAMLTKDNRLVTVSAPAVIRAWDLSPSRLPAGVIADYARLLAGRTLDRAGVPSPLKPTELAALSQTLRATQPALFATEKKHLREWFRQVPELTTLPRLKAATFHLDRLTELDPLDAGVAEQRTKFQACRIPPRDPATPVNLVDLSEAYTHSFGMLRQDFADLPPGVQTLAGTRFDLRGVVRLEAADSEDLGMPGSFRLPGARNIRVGQRCRALHFLQATENGQRGRDGDEVARWVIHYADGSVREWLMVYGEHFRNSWYMPKWDQAPENASQAVIAWAGYPPMAAKAGAESVRLFKATWTNPLPDVEITSLDFILGKSSARPFVVAITAE